MRFALHSLLILKSLANKAGASLINRKNLTNNNNNNILLLYHSYIYV